MKCFLLAPLCATTAFVIAVGRADASVYLPRTAMSVSSSPRPPRPRSAAQLAAARDIRLALRAQRVRGKDGGGGRPIAAVAIPGYGVAEQVFVGGFGTFLSLYNIVITARVLLSWFPQAQSIGLLQPVYAVTDPYLNLFRGLIPPVFGLDLSPLLAFFLLSVASNATAAVGAELPPQYQRQQQIRRQQRLLPLYGARNSHARGGGVGRDWMMKRSQTRNHSVAVVNF